MEIYSKIKKSAVLAMLASFLANTASAMPLSLNESVERALELNENIESAEHSRETAKWQLSAARRQFGPTLGWSSRAERIGGRDYRSANEAHEKYGNNGAYIFDEDGYYMGFASGSTAYNNTFSNSLSVSMPLYTGGQLEGNIKNRRYGLNAADLTLENMRQTIKYQVIEAYYNVLQQQNIVGVNESAVNMAKDQMDLLQVQYEEGERAYSEVLQMQVQKANYDQNLTSAKSSLKVAKFTLLSLIDLPEDTEIELTDKFVYTPNEFSLEECEKYALENRPDLAATIYNVNQAEAAVVSARAGNLPTMTGSASKSIAANGAFQSERSSAWAAGISLNWSIFDNQVTGASVKAAKSEVENLKAQVEAMSKNVSLQVKSAYTQLKAAEENVLLTQKAIAQAEESYKIAVVRHTEGVDILLSVTDAQDKLTQARTNYYSALYQYNLYKAQLEKAMGIPVGFNVPLYVKAEQDGKSSKKALEIAKIESFVGE